jgi:hypothetical protein
VEEGCDLSNPDDGSMRRDDSNDTPLQIWMRELW